MLTCLMIYNRASLHEVMQHLFTKTIPVHDLLVRDVIINVS